MNVIKPHRHIEKAGCHAELDSASQFLNGVEQCGLILIDKLYVA